MPGRPSALDDTKRREICALICAGCGPAAAAHYVGCNPVTIRREARRNIDFYDDLRKAELTAQAIPLQALRKAASSNWRAAAWFLERTQPDAFGLRRPLHYSVDELHDAMEIVFEVLHEEVTNQEIFKRVMRRIGTIFAHFESERRSVETPRRDVHGRRERAKTLRQIVRRPLRPSTESASDNESELLNDSSDSSTNERA